MAINANITLDKNECDAADDNDCDDNAQCTNTHGSYRCQCDQGQNSNFHVPFVEIEKSM